MTTNKINSIQALRALAVILVVYVHCLRDNTESVQAGFFYLSSWGAIGVDLFFAISGFIMVTILPKYIDGESSVTDFIKKRLVRIIPLYWLIASVILFLSRNNSNITHETKLKVFTILPIFDKGSFIFSIIPPAWTLAYELYFYVLIFFLLVFLRNRAVSGILIILCSLSIIGSFVHSNYQVNFLTSPLLLEFSYGVLIGMLYQKIKSSQTEKAKIYHKRIALLCFFTGAALMLLTLFTGWGNNYHLAEEVSADNHLALVRSLFWGIPCALFLYGSAVSERLFQIKIPGILIKIGNASYSCYLIHFLFLRKIKSILTYHFHINTDLSIIVYVTLVLGISLLCYQCIEKPLLKGINFLLKPSNIGRVLYPVPKRKNM